MVALSLTQEQILARFGLEARCRISYRNQRKPVEGKIRQINWKKVVALTIMFEEPRFYIDNGDACCRPGVRVVVKHG